MLGYLARRLLALFPLVLGVVLLGFAIVQLAPGDPVQVLVGDYPAPPEYVKQVRERFGLDAPRWVQLGRYVGEVARGNLGYSFFYNQPVRDVLASRIGATLLLMSSALVLAAVGGVLLGVAGGRRPGSWVDHVLMLLGLVGYSLPVFWLGQLLLIAFSIKLDLLPTQGMRSIAFNLTPVERMLDVVRHLALPALTLATRYVALNVRLTRTSLVEVSAMDYLTTARAKGLAERIVIYKHALRNALIPVVTVMGVNVGHLVAGAVLTETVFAWPGLGRLIFEAILHRDYPVMLGGLLLTSVFVVVGNLLADLACALIDPRIRLEGRA
ncbi:MAG TPA: ABC transporter permease [Candidatus Dormibacteraeota bacterium]|nr:ABC transporter permease [Candidatus Dormibacteraeota bacterium]